jgi:hypothetical protein
MIKMNLKKIIKEVSLFIDENINEFEFIVDVNNFENIGIDFDNNVININECCNVFIRKEDDDELKKLYEGFIVKKVIVDDFLLYIVL